MLVRKHNKGLGLDFSTCNSWYDNFDPMCLGFNAGVSLAGAVGYDTGPLMSLTNPNPNNPNAPQSAWPMVAMLGILAVILVSKK